MENQQNKSSIFEPSVVSQNPNFFSAILFMFWTDIDECSENETICGENAECNNTAGGYACSCVDGYNGEPYSGCQGT